MYPVPDNLDALRCQTTCSNAFTGEALHLIDTRLAADAVNENAGGVQDITQQHSLVGRQCLGDRQLPSASSATQAISLCVLPIR